MGSEMVAGDILILAALRAGSSNVCTQVQYQHIAFQQMTMILQC